jgi:hypothetical protein
MSAIELAQPRIIAIEERGRKYLLTIARITKKQWTHYFEGIVSTSENQSGKRINSFDSTSARVELAESALVDAQGYSTADGSAVNSKQGWQQQIPLRHRQAIANALVDVERAEPADEAIMLGAEAVYLNAVWGADGNGAMLKYRNLCHLFNSPSVEQQKRFSREASRSRIVGGSRRDKTVWLPVQPTLADLYDELIVSVQGYTVNGADLASDRDRIVAEMDTFHKVAAADVLFTPASANVLDEGE